MALAEALRRHEDEARPVPEMLAKDCGCARGGAKKCKGCAQCVKNGGSACACKGCPCEAKKKPKKKLGPVATACEDAEEGQFVVIFVGQPSKDVDGCVVCTVAKHVGVPKCGILVTQKTDGELKSVAMIRGKLQTTQKIRREIRRVSPPRHAMTPMSAAGGC